MIHILQWTCDGTWSFGALLLLLLPSVWCSIQRWFGLVPSSQGLRRDLQRQTENGAANRETEWLMAKTRPKSQLSFQIAQESRK
jgi:hypothetical protein